MPSPRQVLADVISEIWPERVGLASEIAAGMLYRLSEAGYTIGAVGTPETPATITEARPLDDAPRQFRIDLWTSDGAALEAHVAGLSDFQLAEAAYDAAVKRWPKAVITLRQGARVLRESR